MRAPAWRSGRAAARRRRPRRTKGPGGESNAHPQRRNTNDNNGTSALVFKSGFKAHGVKEEVAFLEFGQELSKLYSLLCLSDLRMVTNLDTTSKGMGEGVKLFFVQKNSAGPGLEGVPWSVVCEALCRRRSPLPGCGDLMYSLVLYPYFIY